MAPSTRAAKHGIPFVVLDAAVPASSGWKPLTAIPADADLIVLAGFMPVSAWICEKWPRKIINTHPSLLPKYGGKGMVGVRVQEAVMRAGEREAGCTVHYVSPEIDAGEIILQKSIEVDYETPWQLGGRVFIEENKLLVRRYAKSRPKTGETMAFRWKKLGRVFAPEMVPDRPEWMLGFAQAPNAVIFDDYVRVYFCCRPAPDSNKQFVSYCAFVDLDRRNLFKVVNLCRAPVMSLGDVGAFDEFGTYPVSVIKDGDEMVAVPTAAGRGASRCRSTYRSAWRAATVAQLHETRGRGRCSRFRRTTPSSSPRQKSGSMAINGCLPTPPSAAGFSTTMVVPKSSTSCAWRLRRTACMH